MTTLTNKTVLLTGASRGIGACIARELAKRQVTVVGVSRSPAELETICAQINALGGRGIGVPFDLSRVEQLPNLVEQIEQQVGAVDILINNAGMEIYRAFPDYSLTEMQAVLNLNLLAAMELTRLLLPTLLARRSGHIVNITSLAGKKGHPYDSAYSASKAGLIMWGNALRQELVGTGVCLSSVCPGYVADQGVLADSGIPAPQWAGVSKAQAVVNAVIRAIEQNQAEVVINQGPLPIFSTLTKLLLATEQVFPRFPDITNRWLGVTRLNQMRIDRQAARMGSTGDRHTLHLLK